MTCTFALIAHLALVDDVYTQRGFGPALADRVDLPQPAPRVVDEAKLRRLPRGAELLPSICDATILRLRSAPAYARRVGRQRRRARHRPHRQVHVTSVLLHTDR